MSEDYKPENVSLLNNPKTLWGVLLLVTIPLLIYTFYSQFISQNNSSQPTPVNGVEQGKTVSIRKFASPVVPREDKSAMALPLDQLTAKLAMKLSRKPNDVAGWTLLGRSYVVTGNKEKAIEAFDKALALTPDDAVIPIFYGEALVEFANGKVTSDAKKLFLKAKNIESNHPGVLYNLALADLQKGNIQTAYDVWLKLAKEDTQDSSWSRKAGEKLNIAAGKLGIEPPTLPKKLQPTRSPQALPSALSVEDVQSANKMPSEERDQFIDNMVQRLATRLEKEPNDLQGWLRLARSYSVLGENQKSISSYQQAMKLAPGDREIQEKLEEEKLKVAKASPNN
jgi:cytochrome c-type biogenesis protein CcmH